jgi:uncharacterized membrane protein
MLKIWIITIALLGLSLGAWLICLPRLPDQVATHWNYAGQPDHFMPKTRVIVETHWTGFLPIWILAILSAIVYAQKDEGIRRRIRRYTALFLIPLVLFFAYMQSLDLAWNLGYHASSRRFVGPGVVAFAVAILLAIAAVLAMDLDRKAAREARERLPKNVWFSVVKRGRYLSNLVPCRWQGWAVMALFLAGIVGVGAVIYAAAPTWMVLLIPFLPLWAVLFIVIANRKGEKPASRWPNKE